MKKSAILIIAFTVFSQALCTSVLGDQEIKPGMSLDEVLWKLGNPRGSVEHLGVRTLLYDRGEVKLEDDKVTGSSLISDEDAAAIIADRESARIARAEQAAEEREARTSEGIAEKKRIMRDASFTNRPPREQTAFWDDFKSRYPEVDVEDEIAEAKEQSDAAALQEEQSNKDAEVASTAQEPPKRLSGKKARKARRSGASNPDYKRPSFLSDKKTF